MRKIIYILGFITLLFTYSCTNSDDNNNLQADKDSNTTQNVVVDDSNISDDVNVTDDDVLVAIRAQFNGIVLGSDGGHIMFRGDDGNEYDFFDDGNQQVHNVFADVDPSNPNDMTHLDEWYNITYKQTTKSFYDGGSGQNVDRDVLVIITIEPANGAISTGGGNAITLQTLTNTTFFGTENDISWTLKFNNDKIIFTPTLGEDAYDVFYYYDKISCFTSISDDEVQIKATPNVDKGFIWTITIKREPCSDGMSDNSYPYSINIQWEDAVGSGCGRDL